MADGRVRDLAAPTTRVTRMPSLDPDQIARRGRRRARRIPLDGDPFVIGRDDEQCQIVIPNHAVSREHAADHPRQRPVLHRGPQEPQPHVRQQQGGRPAGRPAQARRPDQDLRLPVPVPRRAAPSRASPRRTCDEPEPRRGGRPSGHDHHRGHRRARAAAQQFLEVQPSDRLRALLEISTSLSRDARTRAAAAADRRHAVRRVPAGRPVLRHPARRRPGGWSRRWSRAAGAGADDARFSRTIVRKCLDIDAVVPERGRLERRRTSAPAAVDRRVPIRSVMCVPLVDRRRQAARGDPARHPGPRPRSSARTT